MLDPGIIGYAALASLALAGKKHRPAPAPRWLPSQQVARATGWLLIAASGIASVFRFGPVFGPVIWTGQICLAALVLVLLLSWRPGLALSLGGVSIAATIIQHI